MQLTTAQVAEQLGIKPETIYAYVSRGVLQRHRGADGRTSYFDSAEVARLAARGRPRRRAVGDREASALVCIPRNPRDVLPSRALAGAGAAILLDSETLTADALREAVRGILSGDGETAAARRLADAAQGYDATNTAADLIEDLLARRAGATRPTPPITRYDHLSLTVTDLARSRAWYARVLGFTEVRSVEGERFERVILVHAGCSVFLGLTCHTDGPEGEFSEQRTGMDHVAFAVGGPDELGAWAAQLVSAGVDHSGVKAARAGWVLTLRDPDNIQVELVAAADR